MAWCTYCLFSYCSELDLLHLLRREHPSNLDRLAGVARQTVLREYSPPLTQSFAGRRGALHLLSSP